MYLANICSSLTLQSDNFHIEPDGELKKLLLDKIDSYRKLLKLGTHLIGGSQNLFAGDRPGLLLS